MRSNSATFTASSTPAPVPRRHLLDRIEADVRAGSHVIVLSAPAGAGKTLTLRQWAQRRRESGDLVAMVDVTDAGKPDELWPNVARSVRAVAQGANCQRMIGRQRSAPSAADSPAAFLSAEIDELPRPIWLVVDDAHLLASRQALGQLGALLTAAQPRMRLALGARYTPQNTLPRLIVDGVAHEYRAADLAFDRDEARAMLLAADVALADADFDLLLERTRGWAAGLRLAAIALASAEDPSSFVATFAGDDHAVADYLVAEVLSALPRDIVDLLLAVSVADVVDVDLAGDLSGRTDAGAILGHLEAVNALVHRAQADPEWYELHPLLRTYLRAEARRRDAQLHVNGHTRASRWFERAGRLHPAVHHAADAEDWERVEHLIASHGARLLMSDGPDTIEALLATLPPGVQMRPSVAAVAALTAAADRNFPAARLDLAALEPPEAVPQARRAIIESIVTVGERRVAAADSDQLAGAIADLAAVAPADPDLTPTARLALAAAATARGDFNTAMSEARDVARIARHLGQDYLLVEGLSVMCGVTLLQGDFAHASQLAGEALEVGAKRSWDQKRWLAAPHVSLAFMEWMRGRDESAAAHAASAAAAAGSVTDPLPDAVARSLIDVTSIHPAAKPGLPTRSHMRDLTELWPMLPPTAVALNCCYQLLAAVRAGDMAWASDIVGHASTYLGDVEDAAVFRALLHTHQGRDADAWRNLDVATSDSAACVCPVSRVIAMALLADLAHRNGQPARSHDALTAALELAEPASMVRAVIDTAPALHDILIRDRGRFGRLEPFVDQVLDYAGNRHREAAGSDAAALTEREMAVLRDLPSLLSLREIAEAHVVSVNTVKTHLKAVYRKLDASNRREAVDHAREIGLL